MRATSCVACGDVRLGATSRCPSCGEDCVRPAELEPAGRVLGATRVHGGSSRATPFDVVLVETHDGLRVVGFANGTIGAGTSVRTVAEDEGVPSFAPA